VVHACISSFSIIHSNQIVTKMIFIGKETTMAIKQNCWEYKNCGREPFGENARILGVCPAATETKLNGVHDGKNAGRSCWVVAGTLCHGKVQGVFSQKYATCRDCDFYQKVQTENFENFQLSVGLLQKLRES